MKPVELLCCYAFKTKTKNTAPLDQGALVQRCQVMISGHWSWESQMAGAATSVAKPYACHAGLAGWEHGWSGGAVFYAGLAGRDGFVG